MSLIEKLDSLLELVALEHSLATKGGRDWADAYHRLNNLSSTLIRDHGPAIRQAMIDAERFKAYHDATFDGNAVYAALDERAKLRTSADNVADVLDALNRVARATGEGEGNG